MKSSKFGKPSPGKPANRSVSKSVSKPAALPKSAVKPKPNYNDPEHVKSALKGYIQIPPEQFKAIKAGDHISYITKTGDFRTGGYVWLKRTDDSKGEYWIYGQTKRIPVGTEAWKASKHFKIYWTTIGKLYKKMDPETNLMIKSIDAKQQGILDIAAFLRYKYGDEFADFIRKRHKSRNSV